MEPAIWCEASADPLPARIPRRPTEGGPMQIKKAPRDGHYPETAQYEPNGYNSEAADQFGDVPESFAVRSARGATQPSTSTAALLTTSHR